MGLDDFIRCEEEDCYCHNHFPHRDGGKEHTVIDNNTFDTTIRCDVAIKGSADDPRREFLIIKCDGCGKYMMGRGLVLESDEVCVRCVGQHILRFLKDEFRGKPCHLTACFPDYVPGLMIDRNVEVQECAECGKEHPLEMDEVTGFYQKDGTKVSFTDGVKPLIEYFDRYLNDLDDANPFWGVANNFLGYLRQKTLDRKELKKVDRVQRRKRGHELMTKYFGSEGITDDAVQRSLPERYLKSGVGIKKVEKLMNTHDVVAFVDFLKSGAPLIWPD